MIRRGTMKNLLFILLVLSLGVLSPGCHSQIPYEAEESPHSIKVGILHSLTGTMAFSEKPLVDAALLAIDEINAAGGILGKEVVPVIIDGESNRDTFAIEAERLILVEKVKAVFGCWTSACRRTVKPIFEKRRHLLFYPVQYEGLEQSPNIVYTGSAPNQQIIPAVKWSFDHLGESFFLVGSDYVFPKIANLIIKDLITSLGGEVVGEEYIPLGSNETSEVIKKIVEAQPQVILNTINGDSNRAFFRDLQKAGIKPEAIPTVSFSIAEHELRKMGIANMVGNYAAWNYFQSLDSKENKNFVSKFKEKYGAGRVVDDPMEAEYFSVILWAQAVRNAGSADPEFVLNAIKRQSLIAPEGYVYIDPENLHTWKHIRIGKIRTDGLFDIVWSSEEPVRPVPYPIYRSVSAWNHILNSLYLGWGENWANPGESKNQRSSSHENF